MVAFGEGPGLWQMSSLASEVLAEDLELIFLEGSQTTLMYVFVLEFFECWDGVKFFYHRGFGHRKSPRNILFTIRLVKRRRVGVLLLLENGRGLQRNALFGFRMKV